MNEANLRIGIVGASGWPGLLRQTLNHKCSRTVSEFVSHALKKQKDPLMGLESSNVRRIEAIIRASEKSAAAGCLPVDASEYLI